ncbi:MAG: hypothetical protein V4764_07285 [Burkholderia sp.]
MDWEAFRSWLAGVRGGSVEARRRRRVIARLAVICGCYLFWPVWLLPLLNTINTAMARHERNVQLREPKAPKNLIRWTAAGLSILDYRIGAPFTTPQCAVHTIGGISDYTYPTSGDCFRYLDHPRAGSLPAGGVQLVQVDRFDLAEHFRFVDWSRPVCVGVERGRIVSIAVYLFPAADPMARDVLLHANLDARRLPDTSVVIHARDFHASQSVVASDWRRDGVLLDYSKSVFRKQDGKLSERLESVVLRGMASDAARGILSNRLVSGVCPGSVDPFRTASS